MTLSGGPVYMALYLNEMEANASQIAAIPMNQIAMIKILSTGFIGTAGGAPGGAIAVYTKKAEDGGNYADYSNLNKIKVQGFSSTRSFVPQEYGTSGENYNRKDNRTTLYWNPNVVINEDNQKMQIRFYNPDNVKKYKIIIQGMSTGGKLLYLEKTVD